MDPMTLTVATYEPMHVTAAGNRVWDVRFEDGTSAYTAPDSPASIALGWYDWIFVDMPVNVRFDGNGDITHIERVEPPHPTIEGIFVRWAERRLAKLRQSA